MDRLRVNPRWLPLWAAMMVWPLVVVRAQKPSLPRSAQPEPPTAASSGPAERPPWAALRPGTTVKVRIRQVFPCDGLSPGERLLSGRQPIQRGDRFLAEVINPTTTPLPLVGGTIIMVTPPGKFGRPGRLTLQMTQVAEYGDGTSRLIPWRFDTEDKRFSTRVQRKLLTSLMGLEGVSVGAGLGSQLLGPASANPVMVTGGAGIGLILGLGYASFRRGVEANLEQGDVFEVVVGTTSYRPVPRTLLTTLFPAPDPSRGKDKGQRQP
jgi:hypothetical protein